jgi:CHAD domain-containing protein
MQLAAMGSDENMEHVHQLRIATRRAEVGIGVFSALIPKAALSSLRDSLRRIRQAADEARNWDVMIVRLSRGAGSRPVILEQLRRRRRAAQGPIVAVHHEMEEEAYSSHFDSIVRKVKSNRNNEGKRRYGRQAPRYLAPVIKEFFKAAESNPTTIESLHKLRIRAKKVRYTMEITAAAFDSVFRRKLYPQITLCQDFLGILNDHATAKKLFGEWASSSKDVAEKAFLEGWLLAEQQASDDFREVFLTTWTPKIFARLKTQFLRYC